MARNFIPCPIATISTFSLDIELARAESGTVSEVAARTL